MDNTQDLLGNDSEVSCITLQHEYDPYLPTHPSTVIPEETLEEGINTPPPISCIYTTCLFENADSSKLTQPDSSSETSSNPIRTSV